MNNNEKDHLWIPDEEVQRLDKKPTSRPTQRNIAFTEHGAKLSFSLQTIKETIDKNARDDSLGDTDIVIFQIELPEGEKVQYKKEMFDTNGLQIKAVKNERNAIVSTTRNQFQSLKRRVDTYMSNGSNKTSFDYIEEFKPFVGSEKNSNELRKTIYSDEIPDTLDVQLMLIPNLDSATYEKAIGRLLEKISQTQGEIKQETYFLSDNTPVIPAIIPSNSLSRYENDSAIYRIEETDFFSVDASNDITIDLNAELDKELQLEHLPIVAVLDSGVVFPPTLSPLIVDHWIAPNSTGGDGEHGTKVASRVTFKYIGQGLVAKILTPRTRIIDCNIIDGSVPVNIFIRRIQAAVDKYGDAVKVFNLSANASTPIEGDEMSIVGYELDALQLRKNVQFIVSAGNHILWKTESNIEDVLDDDDSRISAPADSMLSVVVGAVVGQTHPHSISAKNQIAPYSRRGPGFKGFSKPDLTAYAGTVATEFGAVSVPNDVFSSLLTKDGKIAPDAGTSFSAPIVAGDFAEVLSESSAQDVLLAKALLYHNAQPIWDDESMNDEELAFAHNLYGRGLVSIDDSKYSSPSRVTFVRTGTLNRLTKERVTIYMPEILAAQTGKNVAKVSVTCVSLPPVDRTKGTEYLGAYIRASLKKSSENSAKLLPVQQEFKEGRQKWDVCHQFTKSFSRFNSGDWQVWLELFSRWDDKDVDVPYALVITIEDISATLDIYSEIEALNRYKAINTIRLRVDNKGV